MSLHDYFLVLDLGFETLKKSGCFLTKKPLKSMNQIRIISGRIEKISASPGGKETIVCNRYSYQVPAMFGSNASTNKKHKF